MITLPLSEVISLIKNRIPELTQHQISNGFYLNISRDTNPVLVEVLPNEISFFIKHPDALNILQKNISKQTHTL